MSQKNGIQETKFHPSLRRKVLAAADAEIKQVRVIDSKGQERNLVVYRCGPDVLFADNMDGLFDRERRKVAPDWLVKALDALPLERCFDHMGNPKSKTVSRATSKDDPTLPAAETPKSTAKRPVDLDDDAPSFQGA